MREDASRFGDGSLRRAILRQQRVKLLLRLQFSRAVRAAGHMLLQFMAGIIRQFAINLKHDIFSNPFTFHNPASLVTTTNQVATGAFARLGTGKARPTSSPDPSPHRISASAPRNFCVARNKVFFAVSSVVCKISPTVRSFSPW